MKKRINSMKRGGEDKEEEENFGKRAEEEIK